MVEELVQVDGPVLLVLALPEAVLFAVEIEHVGFFSEVAEGGEELDPLVPGHGVIFVVVDREIGRLDALHPEEGRVFDELEGPRPEWGADPALGFLILEGPGHARAPADAAVGAGHVDDGRARFHGGEHVGLGDHVADLVAAPAVALDADPFRVDETHPENFLDGRDDALEGARPRVADLVDDVGHEDDVTVADIAREIDVRSGRGRIVAVEALGHRFIDVDHERVLFRGVEVVGFDQDGGEGDPVSVNVIDALGLAPAVARLLGIGVADLARGGKTAAAHPKVRELFEPLQREGIDIRVFGLAEAAEELVEHGDTGWVGRVRESRSVSSRGPRDVVRRCQNDGLCRGHRFPVGIEGGISEHDLVAAADTVRDHPGLGPVGQDFPDVISVVNEDRLVSVRPAAAPIGAGLVRRVPGFVDETDTELGRQVESLSVRNAVRVIIAVSVVEIEEIIPAGRNRGPGGRFLQDLLLRAVGEVDEIVVLVAAVPGDELAVGEVGRTQGDLGVLRQGYVGDVRAGQRYELLLLRPEVHDAHQGPLLIFVGLGFLHRLEVRVLPVPDVDLDRLSRVLGLGLGGGGDAEEKPAAVLGELRPALLAHRHPHREALGPGRNQLCGTGGRSQLDGTRGELCNTGSGGELACCRGRLCSPGGRREFVRRWGPIVELGSRFFGLVVVAVAGEGELGPPFVKDQVLVVPQAFEQGNGLARSRFPGEGAVVLRGLGGDAVSQPGSRLAPDVIDDFGDLALFAGGELADDEVGARLFFLLFFFRLFGLGFFLFRLGLDLGFFFGLFLLRFVLLLVGLLQRRFHEVGDEGAGLLGDLEALDPFDGRHLARGQVHDAQAVLGLFLRFLLVLLGLVDVRFGRGEGVGDELAVHGQDGLLAAGGSVFLVCLEVQGDELAVPVLGDEGVDEPLAVARKLCPLDRPPTIVSVVADGLFRPRSRTARDSEREDEDDENDDLQERKSGSFCHGASSGRVGWAKHES